MIPATEVFPTLPFQPPSYHRCLFLWFDGSNEEHKRQKLAKVVTTINKNSHREAGGH